MYGAHGEDDCPVCMQAGHEMKATRTNRRLRMTKEKKSLTALVPCGHTYCADCVAEMQAMLSLW